MRQNPDYTDDIKAIHEGLVDILESHPGGLSEYELFAELASHGLEIFDKSAFEDEHSLFCRHFILFHSLYRLRDELIETRQYLLEITALSIRLHPWREGDDALTEHDPLRDFYLDILELEKATPAGVAEMLGRFWVSYHAQEGRQTALAILGLTDPVNTGEIRQQYRQLAMQHHPDRGGDTEVFQQISAAMRLLERSAPR